MAKQKKISNLKVESGQELPAEFFDAVQFKEHDDYGIPKRLKQGVYIIEAYNGKEAETLAFVPTRGYDRHDSELLFRLVTLMDLMNYALERHKNKKLTLREWFDNAYPEEDEDLL